MLEKLRLVRLVYNNQVLTGEQMRKVRGLILERTMKTVSKLKPFTYHDVTRSQRLVTNQSLRELEADPHFNMAAAHV